MELSKSLTVTSWVLRLIVAGILVQTLFALVPVVLGVLLFVLSFRRDDGER